eukprot:10954298-Alexandrium_andersonii.AAC.1
MSASLVGSEMCIRDRIGPLAPRFRWRIRNLREKLRRKVFSAASATNVEAVSYTHLTLPTICSV